MFRVRRSLWGFLLLTLVSGEPQYLYSEEMWSYGWHTNPRPHGLLANRSDSLPAVLHDGTTRRLLSRPLRNQSASHFSAIALRQPLASDAAQDVVTPIYYHGQPAPQASPAFVAATRLPPPSGAKVILRCTVSTSTFNLAHLNLTRESHFIWEPRILPKKTPEPIWVIGSSGSGGRRNGPISCSSTFYC